MVIDKSNRLFFQDLHRSLEICYRILWGPLAAH